MAAQQDLGEGYPWDAEFDPTSKRPDLKHQVSSISDVSSVASPGSVGGSSTISLPTPNASTEGYRPYAREESDVSHVRLSTQGLDGVLSFQEKRSSASPLLPESLKIGTPPSTTSSTFSPTFSPFRKSSISYEPIVSGEKSKRQSASSRFSMRRKGSLLATSHTSIEEEIDMSLLGGAAAMGVTQDTSYKGVQGDQEDTHMVSSPLGDGSGTFDISSFTGPAMTELNKKEANGILTGGLGVGIKPELTIKIGDLYDAQREPKTPLSPKTPGKASRRISFRKPGLTRTPTVREIGQQEANKRGEVIEVIMEEESAAREDDQDHVPGVDISALEGSSRSSTMDFDNEGFDPLKSRKDTFVSAAKIEVFYPQANWKPFSMRWPWLMGLIVLSVILAVSQESLYRKGRLFTFNSPSELNTWDYFSFRYMPTLVAVSFGIVWQITDFEVKRLEAYYQLSKEGGALAAESINIDYITFFNFLRPVKALRYRHYAVAVSSIATLMAVSLVPTLQAASIELKPSHAERIANPRGDKYIVLNGTFSRLLSIVLILIAILGCILVYQLQRRPSGLVADVKGIAGIAAMANRSHILMDFKNMDTASPEKIHAQLKSHRYSLRNSSLAPEDKKALTQEERDKYDDQRSHSENPHPLMLRLVAGVPFICFMAITMVLIPIFLFSASANVVTEKAPWLLTGIAVTIKLMWGTLETDIRMIEPFYILSKRHASPKVLTLDYTAMAFGWLPIRAFLNGHVLVGLVGLGSVLAEVLTVCATSFGNVSGMDFARGPPSSNSTSNSSSSIVSLRDIESASDGQSAGEETFASFWVSFILALAILTFLCLTSSLVYARRRHPFLPRQPNTIASILAFIHQSKMLYDFVGTEKMDNAEMVERLVGIGKTYGLGWFGGRDGEMHCGVDEEELVGDYRHGEDVRKASMPWNANWETY